MQVAQGDTGIGLVSEEVWTLANSNSTQTVYINPPGLTTMTSRVWWVVGSTCESNSTPMYTYHNYQVGIRVGEQQYCKVFCCVCIMRAKIAPLSPLSPHLPISLWTDCISGVAIILRGL